MDRFKINERIRPIINTWYDWLINYISEPIRKGAGAFQNKILSFLRQTHLNEQSVEKERN